MRGIWRISVSRVLDRVRTSSELLEVWAWTWTHSKFLLLFEHLKLPLPIPSGCTSSQIYFSNHVSLQYSRLCVLTLCVLCLAENSYPFRARLKFLYFSVNVTFGYFMRIFVMEFEALMLWWISASSRMWLPISCVLIMDTFGLFMSAEYYCKLEIIVNNYFNLEILYVWE